MWLMGMKTENLLEGLVSISNVYQEIAGDTLLVRPSSDEGSMLSYSIHSSLGS